VLVLAWNLDHASRCRNRIVEKCKEKNIIQKLTLDSIEFEEGRILFGTQGQAKTNGFGSLVGFSADLILVDVASMWSKSSIELIYDRLGPCLTFTKYPMIIFLG